MRKKRNKNQAARIFKRHFCKPVSTVWIGLLLVMGCQSPPAQTTRWMPKILSDSDTYLPDFSYAGYQWGERALPDYPATISVSDFGAFPNDGKDDSDAILKAVAAANQQTGIAVVRFPPGKFILKKFLFIDRGNFVLQGAGSGVDGTTLYLPLPMKNMPLPDEMRELKEYLVKNNKRVKSGELFSPFSWTGGIIWARIAHKRIYPYLPEKDQPEPVSSTIRNGQP